MISDEFETFGDNHFWHGQTKTYILVQKIIHFIKIQNIHSKQIIIFLKIQNVHLKQIFIFLKFRIFIQKNYSFFKIQNIHSNKIFISLKEAVSPRARVRPPPCILRLFARKDFVKTSIFSTLFNCSSRSIFYIKKD